MNQSVERLNFHTIFWISVGRVSITTCNVLALVWVPFHRAKQEGAPNFDFYPNHTRNSGTRTV
jgi:hypothetical protein